MTGIVLGALGGCLILGVGVGWWDVVVGSLKREIMFCYEFLVFAFIFLHLSWVPTMSYFGLITDGSEDWDIWVGGLFTVMIFVVMSGAVFWPFCLLEACACIYISI